MADVHAVYTAGALIYTGKGQLTGLVLTNSSTTSQKCIFYDNTTNSGTIILQVDVASPQPVILLFDDRFAPRFATGLYLQLGIGLSANVWSRQV